GDDIVKLLPRLHIAARSPLVRARASAEGGISRCLSRADLDASRERLNLCCLQQCAAVAGVLCRVPRCGTSDDSECQDDHENVLRHARYPPQLEDAETESYGRRATAAFATPL